LASSSPPSPSLVLLIAVVVTVVPPVDVIFATVLLPFVLALPLLRLLASSYIFYNKNILN
jgi:hypothetical protein